MTHSTRRERLWAWACSRGFAFAAYLLFAASATYLFRYVNPGTEYVDYVTAIIAGLASFTLVLAGLASAHAVAYGIGSCNSFMVKLELPSLRVLAIVFVLHAYFAFQADRVSNALLQLGVAALLFHEMRSLSVLRKGAHGGHI